MRVGTESEDGQYEGLFSCYFEGKSGELSCHFIASRVLQPILGVDSQLYHGNFEELPLEKVPLVTSRNSTTVYDGQKAKECAKNKIIERGNFLIGSRLDRGLYGST
jgi:hypothetical protein